LSAVERLQDGDELSFEKLKFVVKAPTKTLFSASDDDSDVDKTVVGSAIDPQMIKKAQAELAQKKRLKDAELKKAAQQSLSSQASTKPEAASSSNTMVIVIAVIVVVAAAGGVLFLL
jgi:hypothetical protein